MSTADLGAVLRAAGLDVDWRDLRDSLWLAGVLAPDPEPAPDVPEPAEPDPIAAPQAPPAVTAPPPTPPPRPTAPAPAPADPAPRPTAAGRPLGVRLPPEPAAGRVGPAGTAVRLARPGIVLPEAADVVRSLRPLKRRVPVPGLTVVDEDATVEYVSETALWNPVLRPAVGRWMDLHVVVDSGHSMVVWEPMSEALIALLRRTAAFRRIRRWRLDAGNRIVLRAGRRSTALDHDPRELVDPTGRSIVLLLSDGVGPCWRADRIDSTLSAWATAGPVAIWQPLPPRLWQRTAVRAEQRLIAAARPVQAAGEYVAAGPAVGSRFPVPVLSSDAGLLSRWAGLLANGGAAELPVRLVDRAPGRPRPGRPPADTTGMSADELIARFRSVSSPRAMQLAIYFSAMPLTLDTMRLAQQTMLPTSGASHLAEVFLGGLLREVRLPATARTRLYDFAPGVRDALLSAITRDEAMQVLGLVAEASSLRLTTTGGVRAILAERTEADDLLAPLERPFATVAAAVLDRITPARATLRPAPVDRPPARSGTSSGHFEPVERDVLPPGRDLPVRLRRRTLFVGIGETGSLVGTDLEQQLRAALCGPDGRALMRAGHPARMPYQLPGCVQFVYVDIDADDLRRVRRTAVPGREHDAALRRTGHTTDDLLPAGISASDEVTASLRSKLGPLTGWLPPAEQDVRVAPLSQGAGQLPGVGRAVLFETLRRGGEATRGLRQAVVRLNDSLGDLYAVGDGAIEPAVIDVYVAFSAAGGTGAGMFYDYLHLIARALGDDQRHRIVPLVLLPSAFDEGRGGGRAAQLNGASTLLDLFALVDDQNAPSGSAFDRADDERRVRLPGATDLPGIPSQALSTALLFGRGPAGDGAAADRDDLVRSMSSGIQLMMSGPADAEADPAAERWNPLSEVVDSGAGHRSLPARDGVGRCGVSTAAVATLTVPVPELAELMTARLLSDALGAPAGPAGTTGDVDRFLVASGLGPLLTPAPVVAAPLAQVGGRDRMRTALADRARSAERAVEDLRVRLPATMQSLASSFAPHRAAETMLHDGTSLLQLRRMAVGPGRQGCLERFAAPVPAPDGLPPGSPPDEAPTPTERLAATWPRRVRASDAAVAQVVDQQDRWCAWRTRQIWNGAWLLHERDWGPIWDRWTAELADMLAPLDGYRSAAAPRSAQRWADLRRPRAGVAFVVPDEGRADQLYTEVVRGLGQALGLPPRSTARAVVEGVVGARGWNAAYGSGRTDPASTLRHVEESVRAAVTHQVRDGHGRAVVTPLRELLAEAARGSRAKVNGRSIRGLLADLVPAELRPAGDGELRIQVGYPGDGRGARDEQVEDFLTGAIRLPGTTSRLRAFTVGNPDSVTVALARTGMGLTDVPEIRADLALQQDGLRAGRPEDLLDWRRRFERPAGGGILRAADREQVMQGILGTAWNGRMTVIGPMTSPTAVLLRAGRREDPAIRLALTARPGLSSWADLVRAYEDWLLHVDEGGRDLATALVTARPHDAGTMPAPPAPEFVELFRRGPDELSRLAEIRRHGGARLADIEEFWGSTVRNALDRLLPESRRSLRMLAELTGLSSPS